MAGFVCSSGSPRPVFHPGRERHGSPWKVATCARLCFDRTHASPASPNRSDSLCRVSARRTAGGLCPLDRPSGPDWNSGGATGGCGRPRRRIEPLAPLQQLPCHQRTGCGCAVARIVPGRRFGKHRNIGRPGITSPPHPDCATLRRARPASLSLKPA